MNNNNNRQNANIINYGRMNHRNEQRINAHIANENDNENENQNIDHRNDIYNYYDNLPDNIINNNIKL